VTCVLDLPLRRLYLPIGMKRDQYEKSADKYLNFGQNIWICRATEGKLRRYLKTKGVITIPL